MAKTQDMIVREIDRQYQSDVRQAVTIQSKSGSQAHKVDKQGQGTRQRERGER